LNYNDFLKTKTYSCESVGFDVDYSELNQTLFPIQKDVVKIALKKGRMCLFTDTGTGKTRMQLQFAKSVFDHTHKPVLVVAYLAVVNQTKSEGLQMGIDVNICRTQHDVKPGINITKWCLLDYLTVMK